MSKTEISQLIVALAVLLVSFTFLSQVEAKSAKKYSKKAMTMQMIQQARQASQDSHRNLQQKIMLNNDERIDAYKNSDFEFGQEPVKVKSKVARKSKRRSKVAKKTKLRMPSQVGYYEDVGGVDQSGLGGFSNDIDEEYKIDFDQELREASSLEN